MKQAAGRIERLARTLALAGAMLTCGAVAVAQEFSLNGVVTQGLSYDSDLGLDGGSGSFSSITSLGISAGFETDESSGSLSSSVSYRAVFGDDDESDDLEGFRPDLNGSASFNFGRLTLTEAISFRIDNVAFTDFQSDGSINPDGIFTDSDAERLDFSFTQGVGYALSQRNSLNVSAGVSITRFSESDDELEDSDRFFGSVGVSRAVSPRLSIGVSAVASRFTTGTSLDETTGTTVGVNVGFSRSFQEDISFSGSVGVRYVNIVEQVAVLPVGTVETEETNVGATGGFSFSYDVGNTDLSAGLSQVVSPTEDGDIEEATTLNAGLSHAINSRQSFNLGMSFTRRTNISETVGNSGSSEQEFFGQISPTYAYRLTQNWSANLGYAFRVTNDDDGTEFSNSVFLGFSRPLRIFP
ncbi:MAG: hypothetical protein AAFP17_15125 [Pseudomonadota bacterium]